MRTRLIAGHLPLFNEVGWPRAQATPYAMFIGTVTYDAQGTQSAPVYVATLADAYALTASAPWPPSTPLSGQPGGALRTFDEGYGKFARALLLVAVRVGGVTGIGAQSAVDYLTPLITSGSLGLAANPGWALEE